MELLNQLQQQYPKLKIRYKSGDGESWITKVFGWDGHQYVPIPLTPEQRDDLENHYYDIVFAHDHDDDTGYGWFVIEGRELTQMDYSVDY